MKQGGNNELILQNGSRAVKGVLVNVGNGLTRFIASRTSGDTLFIGLDTLIGIGAAGWKLTGNGGLDSNVHFIGTTDNKPFRIKVDNINSGRISYGNTYFGYGAGRNDTTFVADRSNTGFGHFALYSYPGTVNNPSNTAIGQYALYSYVGTGLEGNTAVGRKALYQLTTGFRNTAVGIGAGNMMTTGARNTNIGVFAGEWMGTGNDNVTVGESSSRLNTIGSFNTSLGNSAAYSLTGSVRTIVVNSSSADWTTATVVIGAPGPGPGGFFPEIQATATANIVGNTIVSVTITEIGAGYYSAPSISFTGDGTSATATATIVGGTGNTAVGSTALYSSRGGTYNVGVGYQTGYGDGTNVNDRRVIDSFNTYVGYAATARGANPQATAINYSTAIGYKSIVTQSRSIVLGDSVTQTLVGIGITAPKTTLQVKGLTLLTNMPNNPTGSYQATTIGGNTSTAYIVTGPTAGILGLTIQRATTGSGAAHLTYYKTGAADYTTPTAASSRVGDILFSSPTTTGTIVQHGSFFNQIGSNGQNSVSSAFAFESRDTNSTTLVSHTILDFFRMQRISGGVALTVANPEFNMTTTSTFNTTSAALRSPALNIVKNSTRASGGNDLTNAGIDINVSGAQLNYPLTAVGGSSGFGTTTPDSTVTIIGGLRINNGAAASGSVWTSQGTDGRATWVEPTTVSGGSYTPTGTTGSNVDAVTPFAVHYTRVDSTVTFSGTVEIDATAAGGAIVELSLPPGLSSAFTSTVDAAGTASTVNGAVYGSVANDRLVILITAAGGAPTQYQFTGSYQIK